MKVCPKCGYELEPESEPSIPFDEDLPTEEVTESSSDAGLYLRLKEKKKRTMFIGGIAASAAVLCIVVVALIFWLVRSDDKQTKVTKKAIPQKAADLASQEVAGALEAILKVRMTATPDVGFSQYTKAVNDAMIELNALPKDTPRVEKLKAIASYYQAAKELWVGLILIENTPLQTIEEKVALSLSLLDLIDRNSGACKKDLDKKDAATCTSLAAFHLWKQRGTYASRDDRRRIKERLDPIRMELWSRAASALDAYERSEANAS